MIERGTTTSGSEGYTLNLVEAPIKAAAKNVLGDILQVSYTIDPRVQGTVSIQTSNPVDKETLVDLFETSLVILRSIHRPARRGLPAGALNRRAGLHAGGFSSFRVARRARRKPASD